MDSDLLAELKRVISLADGEHKSMAMARMINYVLTLPNVTANDVLYKFAEEAYRVIPASQLPGMLAKHCGLSVKRTRRVSFEAEPRVQETAYFQMTPEQRRQKAREKATLGIVNTDLFRKFRPRECFEEDEGDLQMCRTVIVPTVWEGLMNGISSCDGRVQAEKCFKWETYPIAEFLTNPARIKDCLN